MKTVLMMGIVVCAALSGLRTRAIELPPEFSNNMVLQRGVPNRIWGLRTPSVVKDVHVEFRTPDGDTIHRSDSDTKKPMWEVSLPAVNNRKGKGPGSITIWEGARKDANAEKLVLDNVVIGDVWILAVPEGQGFARKAKNLPEVRALPLQSSALLDAPAPPGKYSWSSLDQLESLPALAFQVASSLRAEDPLTPLGLIVTTTEQWPASLQFSSSEDLFKRSTNFLKSALRDATVELRKQRGQEEDEMIRFKHLGLVTNKVTIRAYSDLQASAWKDYPPALQRFEWRYKGVLYPASRP